MFGQTTEVRLCEFWDEEMTYAKELTTRLPIEKIEETIEKVGLEYLRSHSELHNSEEGDSGLEWFEFVRNIPDTLWEQFGFSVKYGYGQRILALWERDMSCVIIPSEYRLANHTERMTALLTEELALRKSSSDISEYMPKIKEFTDRVVPLTLYSTMNETMEIFQKELQKLPEDYWA